MDLRRIELLEGLEEKSPTYVINQLAARIEDMKKLPKDVYDILCSNRGSILDVGPGEGISSMALAHVFKETKVTGVEMDKKHLVGAWPECKKYENLELFWGALPGTPSNSKVDGDIKIPQMCKNIDEPFNVMFSWTGISREDIFENSEKWRELVGETCIFIVPRFWREGSASLKGWDKVKELIEKAGGDTREWNAYSGIEGFSEIETYPIEDKLKARGWILWLSGLFDSMNVSFWNTLTDRWKDEPNYQLPEIELELEIIVVKK